MYVRAAIILSRFCVSEDGVPVPTAVIHVNSPPYDLRIVREHDHNHQYMTCNLRKTGDTLVMSVDDGKVFIYTLYPTSQAPRLVGSEHYVSAVKFHQFVYEDMIYKVPRDLVTLFELPRPCIIQLKRSMCCWWRLELLPEILRAIALLACELFLELDQLKYCVEVTVAQYQ